MHAISIKLNSIFSGVSSNKLFTQQVSSTILFLILVGAILSGSGKRRVVVSGVAIPDYAGSTT